MKESSARWQRVEQICQDALDRPAAERAAFLVVACGEDDLLRHEVEGLLMHEAAGSAFLEWRRSLDVVPLLVDLRRKADEIRKAEIDKARSRLGPLTPEQERAIDAATAAIVNKLLHGPTVQLKEMAGNSQPEHVGFIRKLFGL